LYGHYIYFELEKSARIIYLYEIEKKKETLEQNGERGAQKVDGGARTMCALCGIKGAL
jgi:hypothetical protein